MQLSMNIVLFVFVATTSVLALPLPFDSSSNKARDLAAVNSAELSSRAPAPVHWMNIERHGIQDTDDYHSEGANKQTALEIHEWKRREPVNWMNIQRHGIESREPLNSMLRGYQWDYRRDLPDSELLELERREPVNWMNIERHGIEDTADYHSKGVNKQSSLEMRELAEHIIARTEELERLERRVEAWNRHFHIGVEVQDYHLNPTV